MTAPPLPFTLYSNAALEIGKGGFDLATDAFFMVLAGNTYVPAPDNDATYANVSPGELPSGAGYTVGGKKLSGVSWALAGAVNTFNFAPIAWAAFSAAFRYGVVIRSANGTSLQPTDLLLCYADLGGGALITGTGGALTVTPGAGGAFAASHAP